MTNRTPDVDRTMETCGFEHIEAAIDDTQIDESAGASDTIKALSDLIKSQKETIAAQTAHLATLSKSMKSLERRNAWLEGYPADNANEHDEYDGVQDSADCHRDLQDPAQSDNYNDNDHDWCNDSSNVERHFEWDSDIDYAGPNGNQLQDDLARLKRAVYAIDKAVSKAIKGFPIAQDALAAVELALHPVQSEDLSDHASHEVHEHDSEHV